MPPLHPQPPAPVPPPGWRPGWRPPEPPTPERPPVTVFPPPDEARASWDERLLDQRIVVVTGRLDAERASECAAKLLLLDARGRQPVTLRIDSPGADLTAVWTLVDTLDAMVVPVHALVVGEIGGGSLALLTAVAERYTHPHARFRLADPTLPVLHGPADQIAEEVAAQRALVDAFHQRLAELTGHPVDQIAADLRRGRFLTAPAAVEYGLVTEVRPRRVTPDGPHRPATRGPASATDTPGPDRERPDTPDPR